ncbi:hypothetical protein Glove_326g168 [Diversispora epigaea]|uniref:Uncharacterized protein n=1 Tax=Diversispora epigaea TaxID=1348612 RepID=A0A397HUB7_9GLOM|nr:hypothetical protein Glove_326g168 [Diversispora epigaea]
MTHDRAYEYINRICSSKNISDKISSICTLHRMIWNIIKQWAQIEHLNSRGILILSTSPRRKQPGTTKSKNCKSKREISKDKLKISKTSTQIMKFQRYWFGPRLQIARDFNDFTKEMSNGIKQNFQVSLVSNRDINARNILKQN